MADELPTEVTPPAPAPAEAPPTGGGEQTITLTQAQLDAMFKPRTDEAAKKARATLLTEIGVEDVAAVKAALAAAEAAKQSQMSELEKAQAAADKAKSEVEKAQAERDAALAYAAETLLRAATVSEASGLGFNDPADAWLYLDRAKVETTEAGAYKGLTEAVKAVAEAKPYLLKADTPPAPRGTPTRERRPTAAQPNAAPPAAAERPIVRF